jgi:hypothetical protein
MKGVSARINPTSSKQVVYGCSSGAARAEKENTYKVTLPFCIRTSRARRAVIAAATARLAKVRVVAAGVPAGDIARAPHALARLDGRRGRG